MSTVPNTETTRNTTRKRPARSAPHSPFPAPRYGHGGSRSPSTACGCLRHGPPGLERAAGLARHRHSFAAPAGSARAPGGCYSHGLAVAARPRGSTAGSLRADAAAGSPLHRHCVSSPKGHPAKPAGAAGSPRGWGGAGSGTRGCPSPAPRSRVRVQPIDAGGHLWGDPTAKRNGYSGAGGRPAARDLGRARPGARFTEAALPCAAGSTTREDSRRPALPSRGSAPGRRGLRGRSHREAAAVCAGASPG